MLTRLRALLASKIPIFPLVGLVLVGGLLFAVLAQAEAPFSLFKAGGTVNASTDFGRLMLGSDGTNYRVIASDASGNLQVDVLTGGGSAFVDLATFTQATDFITVLGGYFDDTVGTDPTENDGAAARIDSKRAIVMRIEGETRAVSADVLTAGSTNVANTTNGLWTYSGLMGWDGATWDPVESLLLTADDLSTSRTSLATASFIYGYESVGAVWDRIRMDTAGSLMVSLGTALDSTNDSITAVGQFTDGGTGFTQETSKVLAFGGIFDDTVGTALAENDVASVRINSLRALVGTIESGATRGLFTEVLTAGADDTANTTNGLFAYTALMAWDGTDIDRLISFNWADDVTPGNGTDDGLLGVYSIATTMDQAGTQDRQKTTHITGYSSFPSAACGIVTVTAAAAACTTANFTSVGSFYQVQSNTRMTCRAEEDATTPSVVVGTDAIVESPGIYYWSPVDTNTDTLCCDTASGDGEARVCLVTFP